jgi:hypothetical protein
MSSELDKINAVAMKHIIPAITESIFKTSPFLSYMKKRGEGKEEMEIALANVRARARAYNKRVKLWHHRIYKTKWESSSGLVW